MHLSEIQGKSDKLQGIFLRYQLYHSAGFQMEIEVFPLRKAADLLFEVSGESCSNTTESFFTLFDSNLTAHFKVPRHILKTLTAERIVPFNLIK